MFDKVRLKNISAYILTILLACHIGLVILFYLLFEDIGVWSLIAFAGLSFLSSFLIIRVFFAKNILRKIKLIYSIIHDAKRGVDQNENKTGLNQDINLQDVNDDVMEWASKTQLEISNLKTLESYRKHFLGNISHELKTPIFTIQGYLHSLIEGGVEDVNVRDRFLEKAAANASRLQTIVEDLELINTLERGKSMFQFSNFSISELIVEVADDLLIQAKENHIDIDVESLRKSDYIVKADKESIRQVLTNLIVNAIKYGRQKGFVKVDVLEIPSQYMIEISDNGIGIPDAHIKHVFDRFYRVDASRSRRKGGSGLGLSIVKHIIEAHEQTIDVQSEEGKGTVFRFTLPSKT